MSGRRFGATPAILLAVAVAGLFVLRGLPMPQVSALWPVSRPPTRQAFYAAPGTELVRAKLVGRDQGRKSWEFRAGRITRSVDGIVIQAEDVTEGRVFDDDKISCSFRAGHLRYEVLTRNLKVGGGIRGKLPNGTTFTAGEGEVDLRRKSLVIPGPVKVEGEEVSVTADSLAADLGAKTVTLRGNVTLVWAEGSLRAEEVTDPMEDGTFSVRGGRDERVELTL